MANERIARLAERLVEEGVDAFFANDAVTMGYLHGFWEGSRERFLTLAMNAKGETRLICPALSENQARRSGIENIVSWRDGEDPLALFGALAKEWGLKSAIVAVDNEMAANTLLEMQSALPAALFKAGQPIMSHLMRAKDAKELGFMRRAGAIADKALEKALGAIRPGLTEKQLERVLNDAMTDLGGQPSFCIVATGKNSAEPHHLSDDTAIAKGDIVCLDYGCSVEGYQSDITRMTSCGKASDDAKKVYEIVLEAHLAGKGAVRAGTRAGDVDAATRSVIEKAGYGEYFVHRTGHGIGLRVHEEPYIISGSEVELVVGDCFSIEPGIYLEGRFGMRIENIYTATAEGGESLNAGPPQSIIEVL